MRPLLLVLDVDGVTREGVTDLAHPDVVKGVKRILDLTNTNDKEGKAIPCHIAFVSGTTCVSEHFEDRASNTWREMNVDLRSVFSGHFDAEMLDGSVSVRGLVGASRLIPNTATAVSSKGSAQPKKFTHTMERGFPPSVAMQLAVQMVRIYIEDLARVKTVPAGAVETATNMLQEVDTKLQHYAKVWESEMHNATETGTGNDNANGTPEAREGGVPEFLETTPDCFKDLMVFLQRTAGDPDLKLIINSNWQTRLTGTVEMHDFATCHLPGSITTVDVVKQATDQCTPLDPTMNVAGGLAHREGKMFRFLLACKSDKAMAVDSILQQVRSQKTQEACPVPLIVTVGDTGIDIPMHRKASGAFHVGKRSIQEKNGPEIPQLRMVIAKEGEETDSQHIKGTCVVLAAIAKVLEGDSECLKDEAGFLQKVRTNCDTQSHTLQ